MNEEMGEENYIPEVILKRREERKHLYENRTKRTLPEIIQAINDLEDEVRRITGRQDENTELKENKK